MGQWSFGYDNLNRLTAAAAAANAPAPYANNYGCWSYDAFGNRLSQSMSTTACGSSPPLTSWANYDANNRFTNTSQAPGGVAYDAAGNVTYDGANSYLYDGEGRVCAVKSEPVPGTYTMTGYIYDADGTRVAKGTITSMSCDPAANGFQTTGDYILGPSGEQGTEMAMDANSSMAWRHTNVWAAGRLLATYDPNGLHFYFNDPLGTRRAQTDYAGVLEQTCQSLPFGDALNCTGSTTAPTEHHFTGKERDTESGNDYFGARYYSSAMGRFLSPDWSAKAQPVPYAKMDDPQTLNLYGYLRNNPLGGVDADGHSMQIGGDRAYAGIPPLWVANLLMADQSVADQNAQAQQQLDNKPVGKTTVGSLEKTMTHEDESLSTPKGGDPSELAKGKTALANAIINGAEAPHPPLVATPTVPASSQDAQIMRDAYTNRANGGADPVQGRIFYGTSHEILTSRPACIGCKARETVFARFGPFKDSVGKGQQTYIYIYNNPK